MELFLISHQNYNYDELCLELENICRHEGKFVQEFLSRFILIFHRFYKDGQPSTKDLFEWFLYLLHENNISLVHISKRYGPSIDVDSRSDYVKPTLDVETITQ